MSRHDYNKTILHVCERVSTLWQNHLFFCTITYIQQTYCKFIKQLAHKYLFSQHSSLMVLAAMLASYRPTNQKHQSTHLPPFKAYHLTSPCQLWYLILWMSSGPTLRHTILSFLTSSYIPHLSQFMINLLTFNPHIV